MAKLKFVFLLFLANLSLGGERTLQVLHFNSFLLDVNLLALRTVEQRLPLISYQIGKLNPSPDIVVLNGTWGFRHRNRLAADLRKLGYIHSAYATDVPLITPTDSIAASVTTVGAAAVMLARKLEKGRFNRRAFLTAGLLTMGLGAGAELVDLGLRDWGNGLLVVSKFPIEPKPEAMHFTPHTRPEEYFIFRGAMRVGIEIPDVGVVDIFTTHLGAREYDWNSGNFNARDIQQNLLQLREFGAWYKDVRDRRMRAGISNTIVTGGFNFNYRVVNGGRWTDIYDPAYLHLTDMDPKGIGLIDTYRHVHGFEATPAFTEGPSNGLRAIEKEIAVGDDTTVPGEVSDYILVPGDRRTQAVRSALVLSEYLPKLSRAECDEMVALIGGRHLPPALSTHFGLQAAIRVFGN